MTLPNAAESASASSSASSARPSAAARTRPTRSASCRGPSLNLATIASSAAACAAGSAPVAPPPGTALRAACRVRKLPIVSSRMIERLHVMRLAGAPRTRSDSRPRTPLSVVPEFVVAELFFGALQRVERGVEVLLGVDVIEHRAQLRVAFAEPPLDGHRDLALDTGSQHLDITRVGAYVSLVDGAALFHGAAADRPADGHRQPHVGGVGAARPPPAAGPAG